MNKQLDKWIDPKFQNKLKVVRYKVLCFVIIILFIFLGPTLKDKYNSLMDFRDRFVSQKEKLQNFQEDELDPVKNEIKLLEQLEENQKDFIDCLNIGHCEWLNQELIDNSEHLRDYLLLGGLEFDKMDFNQKKILSNINEVILDTDSLNIDLESIKFASIKDIDTDRWLYKLPIYVNLYLDSRTDLTHFLRNIEREINLDSWKILYKIDSINYDIINYEQPQSVSMNLNVYFYKNS